MGLGQVLGSIGLCSTLRLDVVCLDTDNPMIEIGQVQSKDWAMVQCGDQAGLISGIKPSPKLGFYQAQYCV